LERVKGEVKRRLDTDLHRIYTDYWVRTDGIGLGAGCFVFSNSPQPKPDIVKGEELKDCITVRGGADGICGKKERRTWRLLFNPGMVIGYEG